MNSETTKRFWLCFHRLPEYVQHQANKNYRLWLEDHSHPSIEFKKISSKPYYSARVNTGYRAIGVYVSDEDTIVWFWIGTHTEYDHLVAQLQ